MLASVLRAAVDDIESGRSVGNVGRRLDEWSATVDEHLSNAAGVIDVPDLDRLGHGLLDMIDRAHEHDRKLRDALRGVRLLQEQGLDDLVPGILSTAGFASVDQLQAAIESAAGGTVDVPARAAEDAVSGLSPLPGSIQGSEEERPSATATAENDDSLITDMADPGTNRTNLELVLPGADEAIVTDHVALPPAYTASATEIALADERIVPDGGPVTEALVSDQVPFANFPPATYPQPDDHALPPAGPRVPAEGESTEADSKPGDYEAARQSMLAGDESLASLHDLDFPWDLGTPPLLAALISEQKYALAVCVAEAAEESRVRQRLLRLLCAAFSCEPTALELQLPELSPAEAEVDQLPADECRVLLAAALRAALVLGYSPVGLPSLIDRADLGSNGCRAVIEAAAEAVKRGYRRDAEATALQHRDLPREWAAFETDAQRLSESLAHGKANLQRASKVLHHIVRKDQPVGAVLVMIAELSAEGVAAAAVDAHARKWALIEQLATDLSGAESRGRIIIDADQAVSTKPQLRKAIIAGARTKLDASLREVADLIARFLTVRSAIRLSSRPADLETANELFRAIELQPEDVGVTSVGDAALRQLTAWLRSATPAADAASVEDLIRLAVEPLYEIPRDREGFPVRSPDLAEIRELLRGRDHLEVMRGYLEAGNVAAARRIIAAADDLEEAALDDEVSQGRRDAQNRHQQALEAVDRVAARLRAVYEDEAARELTELTEPLRVAPDDRFDLSIGPLCDLAAKGAARLRSFREDLRQRALDLPGEDADRQRILELIQREDEVLVVEFLTMAEAGHYLPVVNEHHGDDFSELLPGDGERRPDRFQRRRRRGGGGARGRGRDRRSAEPAAGRRTRGLAGTEDQEAAGIRG